MGLCKCSRRRVTNLFCFEHNVNVCEHCLVGADSEHASCIIKSYLHWLDDSEYDPRCALPFCRLSLRDAECSRLVCYHVFHWHCLNRYASELPPNTAPAGYQCPLCRKCLFPPPNLASPVAERLRRQLETVEWGRAGLNSCHQMTTGATPSDNQDEEANDDSPLAALSPLDAPPTAIGPLPDSVEHHESATKLSAAAGAAAAQQPFDADESKYERRPLLDTLARLARNRLPTSRMYYGRRNSTLLCKQICLIFVVGLLILLTGGMMFTGLRRGGDIDESLVDSSDLRHGMHPGADWIPSDGR